MKRTRHSVEQIAGVLKQAETGSPVGDLCRRVGISEQTFYRWKKASRGMLPGEARELKQLRDENTRLKRVVADLTLDKVMPRTREQKSRMSHGHSSAARTVSNGTDPYPCPTSNRPRW